MPCSQILVIHSEGGFYCAGPECLESGLVQAVFGHRRAVNCQTVLRRCPVCQTDAPAPRPAAGELPSAAVGTALCPGSAFVHADRDVECSDASCTVDEPLPRWLARHETIQPCWAKVEQCERCGA